MNKYILLIGIVIFVFFLFITFNDFDDGSIYTKIPANSESEIVKDEIHSIHQKDNHTVTNEEIAIEKMFSYLEEQNHESNKGFQIRLKSKEQKEDKYIMNVYRMVGDLEDLSKVNIGLYSLNKTTGKIVKQ